MTYFVMKSKKFLRNNKKPLEKYIGGPSKYMKDERRKILRIPRRNLKLLDIMSFRDLVILKLSVLVIIRPWARL